MRKIILSSVVVLLSALCVAAPATAEPAVPFHGRATGAITSAVPVPTGLSVQVESTGEATHLGRFTRVETLLLDPASGTIVGLVVFRAANGDTLSGTVHGSFVSASTATGWYHFAGGTGRFAGAGGWAEFSLQSDDGVSFTVEFRGRIEGIGR